MGVASGYGVASAMAGISCAAAVLHGLEYSVVVPSYVAMLLFWLNPYSPFLKERYSRSFIVDGLQSLYL